EVFINTRPDTIAVEEPLEIHVNGTSLTTTMRTPGHDIELVRGLLLAEGLIKDPSEVSTARYCAGAVGPDNQNTYNVLELYVTPANARRELNLVSVQRNPPTSSACGVCGTTSLEQLMSKKGCLIEPITPAP